MNDLTEEEIKTKRRKAHLDFMNKCFDEARNIIAQSQSQEEYNPVHAGGFEQGYWMAKWIALGDDGITWGIPD